MRIDLVENGQPVEVNLDAATGDALAATNLVDARPVSGTGLWALRPVSKVGAIAVAGVEVHVAPKVPIDRVVHLLQYGTAGITWGETDVQVERATELYLAIAEVFERTCRRALQRGLLQGYRIVEEAGPVVRGRIREADQLRRRYGFPLPIEIRYDDFNVDTTENRWLRAAVRRCLRLPGLAPGLRHRLVQLDVVLGDVTPLRAAATLEAWRPTRLNARLHDALRLAELIVRSSSFEIRGHGLLVNGFVINMAKVFEDFVCAAVGAALRSHAGSTQTQHTCHLDLAHEVRMAPDLVWFDQVGQPLAVVDAKYKAERPDGFPDADLYQMLAYCTALGLPVGHLVYAKGNETGRTHEVAGAAVTLRAHVLDLALPPSELMASVRELANQITHDTIPAVNSL